MLLETKITRKLQKPRKTYNPGVTRNHLWGSGKHSDISRSLPEGAKIKNGLSARDISGKCGGNRGESREDSRKCMDIPGISVVIWTKPKEILEEVWGKLGDKSEETSEDIRGKLAGSKGCFGHPWGGHLGNYVALP